MKVRGGVDVQTGSVDVEANAAKEDAKYESQSTTIITKEDIEKKQAKSVEDIIFDETGMTRSVDAMGRVTLSIRGAEPRHTLILVDGQPVMGDFAKYTGAGDELQRLGTENVERIEIIRGAASAKYGADAIGGVVNVITKAAAKSAGMQVNLEGRRVAGDSKIPYTNFFLRADSGDIGKLRVAAYGGKRDVMPVYGEKTFALSDDTLRRNSLRYYGDIKNIGLLASYEIDKNHSISFGLDHVNEDMDRYVKHSSSFFEPQQHFRRTLDRDTYRLSYTGRAGSSDWQVDLDYAKMNEDDTTLTSYVANHTYEGTNILDYVDNIEHRQWSLKASANTQMNDSHLLTYGLGYTQEKGEGSRLKNAPNSYVRSIDPWDYDKNLYTGDKAPTSRVRNYTMTKNAAGVPKYDSDFEWYGYKGADGKSMAPSFTYEDYLKYNNMSTLPPDVEARRTAFANELKADPRNNHLESFFSPWLTMRTYYDEEMRKEQRKNYGHATSWHGKEFMEEFAAQQNKQRIGSAEIKKQYIFLQDTWQINKNTILAPILRVDHSNLFGTHATFNIGMTHNIGGKANQRFKMNLGTGYAEPGMGELYYGWEMYAGAPMGLERARLGYYWVGNPDLKPEKSVNFDLGIEGESRDGRDSYRINAFHNRIDNYMTTYFTGYLMDFHPEADAKQSRWFLPPNMIYSFKNIGKAEITGLEAEYNHRFDKHWSTKLGYTYLHAINKSDPTMPRQLLDRPQHKIDLGVTYENQGWRATLWGNYYLNMLDSNSIANNGNYLDWDGVKGEWRTNFHVGGTQTYEKKSFGIWNFIVQKSFGKDAAAYVGIDNIFNHRDDDRAFQERTYRIGVNMKFGPDAHTKAGERFKKEEVRLIPQDAWFIEKPFDTAKEVGVEVVGDYRWRWNAFTGKMKPANARTTPSATVGSAYKNYLEKAEHGFEQRLRVGVDARLDANTNLKVMASAAGAEGVDTNTDVAKSRGLGHVRLDEANLTVHAKDWDFSLGRITEPMGVTGYYFGKEYDGGRAVWTGTRTQVRMGYGDFRHSTGVADSAYTHATITTFYRAPTVEEFMGSASSTETSEYLNFYRQLKNAKTQAEQHAIIKRMYDIVKKAYPNVRLGYDEFGTEDMVAHIPKTIIRVEEDGVTKEEEVDVKFKLGKFEDHIDSLNYPSGGLYLKHWLQKQIEAYGTEDDVADDDVQGELNKAIRREYREWADPNYVTPLMTLKQYRESVYRFIQSAPDDYKGDTQWGNEAEEANQNASLLTKVYWQAIKATLKHRVEDGTSAPRVGLGKVVGNIVKTTGTVLEADQIPALKQAFYVQARHELTPNLGVAAWYLRSVGNDSHRFLAANGTTNDVSTFDTLANVVGVGAKWQLSKNAALSFDYGVNTTDFGKYMNGHMRYEHKSGTSDFAIKGRETGSAPKFWVMRLDLGKADTNVPHSWNAFIDYKRFEHGSFFGGNGTEALPDRYLDGIKSFTVGAGYVPMENLLVEAFYTFGAKGIGARDTLYGPERFSLGDYARVQLTYRF